MADTKHTNRHHDPGQDRFERSDANFTLIGIWIVVILILVLLTALATWGYYNYYTRAHKAEAMARRSPLLAEDERAQEIAGPVLQTNPAANMRMFDAEQEEHLNSYGWVSREAGVVRLPIDVAIQKVLQPGAMQSRTQDPETTATVPDDGASLPQDSSSGRTFWNLQR